MARQFEDIAPLIDAGSHPDPAIVAELGLPEALTASCTISMARVAAALERIAAAEEAREARESGAPFP